MSLPRRDFLHRLGLTTTALSVPGWVRAAGPSPRPNIIFFLVDDMGWMDTSVYGSRYYDTPNMDRLASQSMTFTDAHTASPLCSPTRASLMSGKHPARLGLTTAAGHRPPLPADQPLLPKQGPPTQPVLLPQSRRHLPPEEYTIAEALRDSGYFTAHLGKWHLGLNAEHWPEEQGFEVSFHGAPDPGPPSYFSPYRFKAGTVTDGPEGEYIADRLTDEAIRLLRDERDEPLFLNLWHYSIHGPWGHKEQLMEQYRDRVDPRGKQDNPIMASMLKSVDESLGRVVDELDSLGIADNTILIFYSDNGGNVHSRIGPDELPPTNNDPLRAGKGSIYEGGTRVPLMVRWPGVVEAGARSAEVISSVDFYPTLLEMAAVDAQPEQVLDGESFVPVLRQRRSLQREATFCYFPHGGPARPPGVSVRKGDWKLIRWYVTSSQFPDEHELYNLKTDIGETTNLADRERRKTRELSALIDEFLASTDAVVPVENPAFDSNTLPVAGWQRVGQTVLTLGEAGLVLESPEGRTQMATRDVPRVSGPLRFEIRARSTVGGTGLFYWATSDDPQFARERRVGFEPIHDGAWHEYELSFTAGADLAGLRYDGSTTPTALEIEWIRLRSDEGTVLNEWDFTGP